MFPQIRKGHVVLIGNRTGIILNYKKDTYVQC